MTWQSSDSPGESPADEGATAAPPDEPTPSGVLFTLDAEGDIASWSGAAQELYGYEAADVVGRGLGVLFGRDKEPSVDVLLDAAERRPVDDERWHERADESDFWATCTISAPTGDRRDGYLVVSRDTTAHRQYERSLERQNDRLKEFTDILSHDLRTPLSVIDGRLELYRETGDAEHLEAVEATTGRMERLVEDLLRVARQGRMVEEPQPTDIESVLGTTREGTLPPGARLHYEPVPRVMADRDRLCELFENLLRNSVEHSSTGDRAEADSGVEQGEETVTVRVGPLEDGTGFYVEDDGPGIPEDYRNRVFDHGFTTRASGTGYGLSVVRSIVGAHGWNVAVTDAEGGGARFEFTDVEFVD